MMARKTAGYGLSAENPVFVAGGMTHGAVNERRYLSRLRCPNGKPVEFRRRGSINPFVSRGAESFCKAMAGKSEAKVKAMIFSAKNRSVDVYDVKCLCGEHEIEVFMNMYDEGSDEPIDVPGWTLAPLPAGDQGGAAMRFWQRLWGKESREKRRTRKRYDMAIYGAATDVCEAAHARGDITTKDVAIIAQKHGIPLSTVLCIADPTINLECADRMIQYLGTIADDLPVGVLDRMPEVVDVLMMARDANNGRVSLAAISDIADNHEMRDCTSRFALACILDANPDVQTCGTRTILSSQRRLDDCAYARLTYAFCAVWDTFHTLDPELVRHMPVDECFRLLRILTDPIAPNTGAFDQFIDEHVSDAVQRSRAKEAFLLTAASYRIP